MKVGIDAGFGNVKVVYDNEGTEAKFDFTSSLSKFNDFIDVDVVKFNDEFFKVGNGELILNNGHLSKENDDTRVLIWNALHQIHLKTGAVDFDVVVNCALDNYKLDKGNSVANKMQEIKTIKVKEKFKEEVTLKINNLVVMPEGLSGGLLAKLKLKEEEIVVIDIGTLNIQGVQLVKASVKQDTTFTTTLGMQHIYRALSDRLKIIVKGLNSASAVQMYLEKTANAKIETIQEADEVILNYLIDVIFKELDLSLNDLKMSMFAKLVFVGGGSLTLKRFIDTRFLDKEKVYVKDALTVIHRNNLPK